MRCRSTTQSLLDEVPDPGEFLLPPGLKDGEGVGEVVREDSGRHHRLLGERTFTPDDNRLSVPDCVKELIDGIGLSTGDDPAQFMEEMAICPPCPPEMVGGGKPRSLQVMGSGHPTTDHLECIQAGEDLFPDTTAHHTTFDPPVQERVAAWVRLGGNTGVILPAIQDLLSIEAYRGERAISSVPLYVPPVEVPKIGYRVEVEEDVRAVVGADLDPGDQGDSHTLSLCLDNATYLVVVGDRKPDTLLCRKSQRILHTGGGVGVAGVEVEVCREIPETPDLPGQGSFEYDVPVVKHGRSI